MGGTALSAKVANVNKPNLHILDSASEPQVRSETSDAPPPHRHAGCPTGGWVFIGTARYGVLAIFGQVTSEPPGQAITD
jgi:hypothetical protein